MLERLLCATAGVTSDANTPLAARPRPGVVSFLHRFGSALNHHVHLQACVTDGVFVPIIDGTSCYAPPAFLPTGLITHIHLAAVTDRVRRRVIRRFRLTRLLAAAAAADMLAWENSGFSIDASESRSSTATCRAIFGVWNTCGPNHKLRRAVTALTIGNIGKSRDAAARGHAGNLHATGCCDTHAKPSSHDTSRIAWAKLIARVGEEFPLECPACAREIRLIDFIAEPGPIRKIPMHVLLHTGRQTARTAASVAGSRAAHLLGRARASP